MWNFVLHFVDADCLAKIKVFNMSLLDRMRLAKVAYLSLLYNESMSIEVLYEATNRSADDEEVKETIAVYGGGSNV